jgi:hypothetical protein
MTRTDPSNGALNRSAGLWHTPASAASLGPTHYGEVSAPLPLLLIITVDSHSGGWTDKRGPVTRLTALPAND